jgi:hypothetical protein
VPPQTPGWRLGKKDDAPGRKTSPFEARMALREERCALGKEDDVSGTKISAREGR